MSITERTSELSAKIHDYCAANANPKLAEKYGRYFKEGYDSWGIWGADHPFYTEKQDGWFNEYQDLKLNGFLKLGEELFASGKYEEGALAIRFLKSFKDQVDNKAVPKVARWFAAGIGNWAHTDVLCGEILAPALVNGRITLNTLAPWRESEWKYQRRAVPVAMLSLLKTDHPIPPLLDFIRPLMLDEERVVHQGLGWFLREAWKKQPELVEAFLMDWKDEAPRLIFQYATEKMTPAARDRFRRTRAAARR